MNKTTVLRLAALFGGAGVMLGAFGAHGLERRVPEDLLAIFDTGVRYHMYHAIALFALAAAAPDRLSRPITVAALCWIGGIVVFSGSLYLLTLTGVRWLGAITPIGGVALITGWIAAAIGARSLIQPRD